MINQLFMGKGTQSTARKENRCAKGRVSQNITVVLPAYNEEVSIGSIILLTRLYADNVVVIDDCSSDRTAEIAKKAGAEVIVRATDIRCRVSLSRASMLHIVFAKRRGGDLLSRLRSVFGMRKLSGQPDPAT